MLDITLMLKSSFTVEVTGERPERFLNAAAANGIYISEARPVKNGLRLRLSRRACKIMEENMPEGLELELVREHGVPRIMRRFKKRYLLFGGAALTAAVIFVFSKFVWRVEISGGTPELQEEVSVFLEENDIRPGIAKKDIDQTKIKREAILSIDDLMWLWVDLKGTTAYVRIAARSLPPEHISEEPANVIAGETGVIEKITTLEGRAAVGEGETVEKGSILISGAIESERIEETMFRHAQGSAIARVWREKSVLIPKVTEKRNKTGNVQKIRSIKIKKFIVNFSLNSSILYPKYDRIRTKYSIGSLPVEFITDEYEEVEAETAMVDMEKAIADSRADFEKEITDSGAEIQKIDIKENDMGDYLELLMTAECLTDIAVEVPIQ